MMFRLFQTDKSTSAIHINMGEISANRHSEFLETIISDAISGKMHELLKKLVESADDEKVCRALLVIQSYLHELRHSIDLIFTPAGFYNIRTTIEFAHTFKQALRKQKIPIPLMSGLDLVNREMLGLSMFETTPGYQLAKLMMNRQKIINKDSQVYDLGNGKKGGAGADQILEGLAAGLQQDFLVNLFDRPSVREKFPEYFDYSNMPDWMFKKYIWLGATSQQFGESIQASRLVYCIGFAALCGSMAPRTDNLKAGSHLNFGEFSNMRDLSNEIPSVRFKKLMDFFSKRSVPEGEWEDIWLAVDKAVIDIWGKSVAEIIYTDIEYDEAYLRGLKDIYINTPDLEVLPEMVLKDLVNTRRRLLHLFRKHPTWFIAPHEFVFNLMPSFTPVVIYNYPRGVPYDIETSEWKKSMEWSISNKVYSYPAPLNKIANSDTIYAFIQPTCSQPSNSTLQSAHLESWLSMCSIVSPLYKLLLHGNHYKPMIGIEVSEIQILMSKYFDTEFIWDDIYKKAKDNISSATEYFKFHELSSAQCDLCSRSCTAETSQLISGLTFRDNPKLIEEHKQKRGELIAALTFDKDWSNWLLCDSCLVKWGYIENESLQKPKFILRRILNRLILRGH